MKISKKKLPAALMAAAILSSSIISVTGFWLTSRHKAARILDLQEQFTRRLGSLAEQLQAEVNRAVQEALNAPAPAVDRTSSPDARLAAVKAMTLNHPLVEYPFIITDHNELLFPLSRETRPATSALRGQDALSASAPAANPLWKLGAQLEYRDKNLPEAIRSYSRLATQPLPANARAAVYEAIGRCYFKMQAYPQALNFYGRVLAEPAPNGSDFLTWITALRQSALAADRMGDEENSLLFYSRLYEKTLAPPPPGSGDLLPFYRNEAEDRLNRRAIGQSVPSAQPPQASITSRDLAKTPTPPAEPGAVLNWRYFEFRENASDSDPADPEADSRIRRLRELMDSTDEKSQFYKTLKNASIWSARPSDAQNIITPLLRSNNEIAGYIVWSLQPGDAGRPGVFRGFSLSLPYIQAHFLPRLAEKEWQDPALSLVFAGDNPHNFPAASLADMFPETRLVLNPTNPQYIENLALRDIRLYYLLLSLIILSLLSAIFLLYRYLSGETELARLRAEFTDRMSHTLKTPLTRISLLAENIAEGWTANKEQEKEYLNAIIAETANMSRLIDAMLKFSRENAGELRYTPQWISLQALIPNVLENHAGYLQKHGFHTDLQLDETAPRVWLDPNGATTIIDNLIQNALKYSLGEKYLGIRVSADPKGVVLEVRDHGVGIPAREQSRIFDPYVRARDPRVGAVEGGGLGLYLTRRAVEAHNGKITVQSSEGKGTAFHIIFPITEKKHE